MLAEEQGTVVKIEGGRASVQLDRKGSCGSCGMCAAMMPSSCTLEVDVVADLRQGSRVVVGFESGNTLISALLVFGLPLLALIAGLVIGQTLPLAAFGKNLSSLVYVIILIALSLMPAVLYERRLKKTLSPPKLLRII